MDLIIKNKIIEAPIPEILKAVRTATGDYYFNHIGRANQENLMVTCPYHKSGQESHPSATVYNNPDSEEVPYGFFKCFTCGKKAPLYSVIGHCFERDDDFGKDWLCENFGKLIDSRPTLKPLYNKVVKNKIILDPSTLDDFNYIHPYMYKRKLTDEVISMFKVGYDPETDCITFPCWDIHNNLVAINRRSVAGKRFEITSDTEKEVYLLNFILNRNYPTVHVCESQINALTCWSYGIPAVALLGTGAKNQYKILQKSGIRNYVLCLDPDMAGRIGTVRFIKNMKDIFAAISIKDLPDGKDVNDLTREEFFNAPVISIEEWCKRHNMVIT